ncbi:MAG: phage minor head protein, partial [Alphaproteobacteria bacterium]
MSKITLEPVPPEEAIAALRARGAKLSKTFDWRDMWQEAHATAFTVAKSTGFDILGDIYQAVDDALVKGTTFDDFKLKLTPILQKKGWWGQKLMKDPLSGRTRKVQLGSVRRLRIIFDTNLRTAYAAGTWARIQRSKKTRPYLRYVAVMDGRTRPEHQAWHDTVLPVDHEWWSKHYPPNGWNCRCTVQSLNNRDLKRYDLKVTEVPPSTKENPYTNPRNGEVVMVPQGIDPGFVYNPGAASIDGNAARLFLEKATPLPPQVTAEVMAESARVVVPALTRDFETWVDQVSQSNWKALGDIKPVGALSKPVIDYLALKKATPLSGVITLQDADLLHMVRDKKRD